MVSKTIGANILNAPQGNEVKSFQLTLSPQNANTPACIM